MRKPITKSPAARPVSVAPVAFGGPGLPVLAGPCAVQLPARFAEVARVRRGGIFKLRANPRWFQGPGRALRDRARAVREEMGLPLVFEIVGPREGGAFVRLFRRFARRLAALDRPLPTRP